MCLNQPGCGFVCGFMGINLVAGLCVVSDPRTSSPTHRDETFLRFQGYFFERVDETFAGIGSETRDARNDRATRQKTFTEVILHSNRPVPKLPIHHRVRRHVPHLR